MAIDYKVRKVSMRLRDGKRVTFRSAICPYCGKRKQLFYLGEEMAISTYACPGNIEYPEGIILPRGQVINALEYRKDRDGEGTKPA